MASLTYLSKQSLRAYSTRTDIEGSSKQQIYGTDVLLEEETLPRYQADNYYPARMNEVINMKYRVVAKLGFGISSTVWLAQDITRWKWLSNRYVILKILTKPFSTRDVKNMELEASKRIRSAAYRQEGSNYVRAVRDSFQVGSPESPHLALVYDPMRESLAAFQQRCVNSKIPSYLLKVLIRLLLQGLDFLHTKCHIIHTDLKPENIMIGLESNAVLDELASEERSSPSDYKIDGGRYIYGRRHLGGFRGSPGRPQIGDLGSAVWGHEETHNHAIQPELLRSPEVILGAEWSYSADIWNLGVMMWDLLEDKTLFRAQDSASRYDPQAHLAEMKTILGPPPKELLKKEGMTSSSSFDANNNEIILNGRPTTQAGVLALEDTTPTLDAEEREGFCRFARKMLRWMPEERETASQLLTDPWLQT